MLQGRKQAFHVLRAHRLQVDPLTPGKFEFWETCEKDLQQVKPTYQNLKNNKVANICKLSNLFLTKRQKLYEEVCSAVFRHASGNSSRDQDQDGKAKSKLPFEVIKIAGDGRCGWRSILAAQDIKAFQSVQRSWVIESAHLYAAPWLYSHIVYIHI